MSTEGSGATSTTVKDNAVMKKEKLDVNFKTIRQHGSTPSPTAYTHLSDENVNATTTANNNNNPPTASIASVPTNDAKLNTFDDLSWITVGEEIDEVTLRVHEIGDSYKQARTAAAYTADDEIIKLKSFREATDRVYQTFKDNEIVHITTMKATPLFNPRLHGSCKLKAELRIENNSVVTGIRRLPSAYIKDNFGELTQGTNDRIRMGILTAFVKKAEEHGSRVRPKPQPRRTQYALQQHGLCNSLREGIDLRHQGLRGVMKISAQPEDIEGVVRKENNIPDIKNTCSTPKKAKLA